MIIVTTPTGAIGHQVLENVLRGEEPIRVIARDPARLRTEGAQEPVERVRDVIRDKVRAESPWWVPNAVDDKLYEKIVSGIERTLAEVAADEAHPLRSQFERTVREFIDKLHSSPETIARAEAMKERLLEHPAVAEAADQACCRSLGVCGAGAERQTARQLRWRRGRRPW